MGTLEGIVGCVSAGLGWTLLPRRALDLSPLAAELEKKPVADPIARVPTLMVRHADGVPMQAMDTLAQAFVERPA